MHQRSVFLSLLFLALLAACVPSPTATPPRATPFPTLPPTPTDGPALTITITPRPFVSSPTLAPAATLTATRAAPPSPGPSPTSAIIPPNATPNTSPSALISSFSPLLQVFPSEVNTTVSLGQTVSFGVLAAGPAGLSRVELYDEKNLEDAETTSEPRPTLFSGVLSWKPDSPGPHRLSVVAFDANGNTSAPTLFSYNVVTDNRRPAVQFTNYVGQIDVPVGAPVRLQGQATDEALVTRVDLYVDDLPFTYLAPNNGLGQTPFSFNLMWTPPTPGIHKLYLRAHDNEAQTGDSPVLLVNALAGQPPSLSVRFEREEVLANDWLVVNVLALSPLGITRVELIADDQPVSSAASLAPGGQAVTNTFVVWQAPDKPGDHGLLVRVTDATGQTVSSAVQVVHVRTAGSKLATPTPIPPRPSPTRIAPLPSATPQVIEPAPPQVSLSTDQDRTAASIAEPLRVNIAAHGGAELDSVELWAFYQGETTSELAFTDSIKGSTEKNLTANWTPPRAGIAFLFARLQDQLGRSAQSPLLMVYLVPPAMPLPTPAYPTLGMRWTASIPTTRFDMSMVQIGKAIRGPFTSTPLNAPSIPGDIVSGTIDRDRLFFIVSFANPQVVPRALAFECLIGASPEQLACNYTDEVGNQGSAVFTPAK